jgi:hypothetical protein
MADLARIAALVAISAAKTRPGQVELADETLVDHR